MAYTKIHAIKATVDKAIDYICNPEKTDDKIFISSYACSPETAAIDLLLEKSIPPKLTRLDRNLPTEF